MAAKTLGSRINTKSFSHASGSVPKLIYAPENPETFFPRKWECSVKVRTFGMNFSLFPTQVGVFLSTLRYCLET